MAPRLSDRERVLRTISEADWQGTVEGIARFGGWLYFHAPANLPRVNAAGRRWVQNVRAGFPDFCALLAGRLIVVELKTQTGKATDEQITWLEEFAAAGVEVGIWRPGDVGLVQEVLLRGAPMPPWSRDA